MSCDHQTDKPEVAACGFRLSLPVPSAGGRAVRHGAAVSTPGEIETPFPVSKPCLALASIRYERHAPSHRPADLFHRLSLPTILAYMRLCVGEFA